MTAQLEFYSCDIVGLTHVNINIYCEPAVSVFNWGFHCLCRCEMVAMVMVT